MDLSLKRSFVSESLIINDFEDLKPYFDQLTKRDLSKREYVEQWLRDRSELEAIISEDMAWRYIKMNCDTADEAAAESFNHFVANIEPDIAKATNVLDKIIMQPGVNRRMDVNKYFSVLREVRKELELFREENIPIEAELQQKEQHYGGIASRMTIKYQGEEMTLQKAGNFLKNTDRSVREEVFRLMNDRRLQDKEELDNLLSELILLRQQIAQNAGYDNYRDFKFKQLGRFDYQVQDCLTFHDTVAEVVKPVVDELLKERQQALNLDRLRPWDLPVDEKLLPPLQPFNDPEEMIQKTILCFRDLEPEFGVYLNKLHKMGHTDLASRKGKAPGGFNYPLHESNIPFIYMNATGNFHDVITMIHEGGHAVHSFLCAPLELTDFKDTPSEVAELASMSMELLTMDYWHLFFDKEEDLKRAKREHLADVISVLPWVATVDKFQHFLYENPKHTVEERAEAWTRIANELGSDVVDYSGMEPYKTYQWQRQLHIYEVPFYYIEYGFAQLGALAIWRNYRENPEQTIQNFKNALKLGYTTTIPLIYKTAGIEFNFSKEYIQEIMDFVLKELRSL